MQIFESAYNLKNKTKDWMVESKGYQPNKTESDLTSIFLGEVGAGKTTYFNKLTGS